MLAVVDDVWHIVDLRAQVSEDNHDLSFSWLLLAVQILVVALE